jgi:hypothetical protein
MNGIDTRETALTKYLNDFNSYYAKEANNSKNTWYILKQHKKSEYYALVERINDNYILKKGSIIKSIEVYDNVKNENKWWFKENRYIRESIETIQKTFDENEYTIVTKDFEIKGQRNTLRMITTIWSSSTHLIKWIPHKHNEIHNEVTTEVQNNNKATVVLAELSNKTNGITEEGKGELTSLINEEYDKRKQQELEEQEKKRKDLTYTYETVGEFKNESLAFNNDKVEEVIDILHRENIVFVTGPSRVGKTKLCIQCASKISNKDLESYDGETLHLDNVLLLKSSTSEEKAKEELARFFNHVNDYEMSLLIINEATKDNLHSVLPCWEAMDIDGVKFKDLLQSEKLYINYNGTKIGYPKNLRVLSNVATEQFNSQIENRFKNIVDLGDIQLKDAPDISNYTNIPQNIIEILIKYQICFVQRWGKLTGQFIVPSKLNFNKVETLRKYYDEKIRFATIGELREEKQTLLDYINSISEE